MSATKAIRRFGGKKKRLPFLQEPCRQGPLRRHQTPTPAAAGGETVDGSSNVNDDEGEDEPKPVFGGLFLRAANQLAVLLLKTGHLIVDCTCHLAIDFIDYIKDGRQIETEIQVSVFPRCSIYLLMVLSVWSRISIVLSPEGLWMVHPDELFQSVEVAHSEVYGYGFRPYEFFSPPVDGNPSVMWSPTLERYRQLGMYSMRSFMYPAIYRWLFMAREYFGWVLPPFQLAKLFHSIVAVFLPFIIYKFAFFLCGNKRDPALLCAVLVAFSQPLLILGTHTFVQSFLSPLLFLSLSAVLGKCNQIGNEDDSPPFVQEKERTKESDVIDNDGDKSSDDKSTAEDEDDDFDFDLNDNKRQLVITDSHGQLIELDVIDVQYRRGVKRRRFVARCASIFCIFVCGFIFGFSIYVRSDTILIVITVLTFLSLPIRRQLHNFLRVGIPLIAGCAVAFYVSGRSDFDNYGRWFISPYQWLGFQRLYAHKLFGSHDFFTYIREFTNKSHSTYIIFSATIITGVLQLVQRFHSSSVFLNTFAKQNAIELRTWRRLAGATFIIFLVYSSHSHKELRFIHDLIVVFLVLAGVSLYIVFKTFYVFLVEIADLAANKRRFIKLLLYGEVMLYIFAGRLNLPYASNPTSVQPWTYAGLGESGLVNQCLMYLTRQNDVKGVVIDYSIHMTGAYSLLHLEVPLIAKTHYEFREWAMEDRLVLPTISPLTGKNISVSILDRISNFIAVENAGLLLKHISRSESYNYIITTGGRKLPKKGFRQVYNASDVRVFKKGSSRLDKEALTELGNRIPVGNNATILEYEGSWLITMELFSVAIERLQEALKLDPSRIRSWQLLSHALNRLDRRAEASEAMNQCHALYKDGKCLLPTDKIVLHSEYQL